MTENLMQQFLKDADSIEPTDVELNTIRKLACDQRDWEKKVSQLKFELDSATEALRQIQEFLLPNAMSAVGMSEFKMIDGSKITIKDDLDASVRADHASDAFDWLTEQGLDGIIKDNVTVKFDKGQTENAQIIMAFCKNHKFNAEEKMSVHPQTLKATVKEQMAKGIQFPDELFSIHPRKKAIIK